MALSRTWKIVLIVVAALLALTVVLTIGLPGVWHGSGVSQPQQASVD